MDAKLAAAFSRIATRETASNILLDKEVMAVQCKLLKGRQIYKMLFDRFQIAEAEGAVLDFRDLLNVRLKGDNLEKLWTECETALMGLRERPTDAILEFSYSHALGALRSLSRKLWGIQPLRGRRGDL